MSGGWFAGCPLGVEEALSAELTEVGARDVVVHPAGVRFAANREVVARACLWLRSATRVQEILLERTVGSDQDLYEAVRSVRWKKLLGPKATFAVEASLHDSFYKDPRFLVHRVKDGVADRMRDDTGQRPDVERHRPDLPLFALLRGDQFQLSRMWAPSLHRRGYRDPRSKSPVNEALAAGLLHLAGWRGDGVFVDPMCGSGTFLVEAALVAGRVAPGLGRRFPFEMWPDFEPNVWRSLVEEARSMRREVEPVRGADRDSEAVAIVRGAARQAGVRVEVETCDIADFEPPSPSLVVTNPPWGQRMGAGEDLVRSWKELGHFLRRRCTGATAWVLSGNAELTGNLGLKTSRRIPLPVAQMDCRFLRYEIHPRREAASASKPGPTA